MKNNMFSIFLINEIKSWFLQKTKSLRVESFSLRGNCMTIEMHHVKDFFNEIFMFTIGQLKQLAIIFFHSNEFLSSFSISNFLELYSELKWQSSSLFHASQNHEEIRGWVTLNRDSLSRRFFIQFFFFLCNLCWFFWTTDEKKKSIRGEANRRVEK